MGADNYPYGSALMVLPLTGANNGTVIKDLSPRNIIPRCIGNARTVTSVSKFYGSSLFVDGAGDRLDVDIPAIRTQDFYLGFWLRPYNNGGAQAWGRIVQIGADSVNGGLWLVREATTIPMNIIGQTYSAGYKDIFPWKAQGLTNEVWWHFALCRQAGTWMRFLNGVLVNSGTQTLGYDLTGTVMAVGCNRAGSESFNAHLNDLVLVVGDAVVTENFTPPTRLAISLSGEVRDKDGVPTQRTVFAVPRGYPTNVTSQTQSDPVTGGYSLTVPYVEHCVICLGDDAGTLENDLIHRAFPV